MCSLSKMYSPLRVQERQASLFDEDTPLEDVATRMAEDGIDPVVVVRGDKLAGLITREQLVRLVISEEGTAGGTS